MVTMLDRQTVPGARPAGPLPGSRTPLNLAGLVAAAALGVGMVLVVGLDGSPGWAAVRAGVAVLVALVAAGAARRLPRLGGAALMTAVGVLAAPVALTIGLRYWARTGVSAKALGGVVASGGALVLLGLGAGLLLKGARWWGRLLAVAVAGVLGFFVAMPLTTAVYATNLPRPALGPQTPHDFGLAYRDVSLVTSDGVALSGWYIPSANRAAVALLHGASETRTNVLPEASVLARHGYGVLLFDARGHGLSAGRAMDFGWYGDRDVGAAVRWLQAQPDVDPSRIGAVGMSMGGEEALGAMVSNPLLRAVVGEGVTGRVPADQAWLSDRYGIRGTVTRWSHEITYGVAGLLTDAAEPGSLRSAVAAAAPRPVLLIAAGTVEDEGYAAAFIEAGSPSTVQVWVVPGASHTSGLRTAPGQWEQRVAGFLDRALLAR